MKHINLIFILLISVFFSSCDKDENVDPDLPACKLTKETFVVGNDQSSVTYTYDDSGRLIKLVEKDGAYSLSLNFNYNEKGQIIEIYGIDNDVEFKGTCTWENNLWSTVFTMKDGDNWIETEWKPVVKFNDSNQIIEYMDYEKNQTGAFELYRKDVYTWENGNITSTAVTIYSTAKRVTRKILKRKNKQFLADYSYTTTYTYDDKNNAYASVGIMNVIWNELPVTKNNVIKEEMNSAQGFNTIEYTYEYNDKVFPVKLTSSNMDEGNYIEFEYECN
ncbi:MAG: hypothetical protein L3J74_08910 [Bacteroidales bacterium]|nr:hypothetical protein [Bacteroidales bacterium]